MGLARSHRLKNRKDFVALYQNGGRYASPHLILRTLRTIATDKPRTPLPTQFGISISQKVSKKAVIRNRIKRQIRQVIRELLPTISGGWKVVIVVRPGSVECNYEHFLGELKQLLVKARIINGY